MARIDFPTPETMSVEQRKVYDAIISGPRKTLVGPLRAALHNPELADRWQKMGALLRFGTSVPPILSELAILVTARRWNSQIEWYIHALAAQKAGLSDAVINAIRIAEVPSFENEAQANIYEFARQLLQYGEVREDCYQRVHTQLQTVGIVELTAIIGYYTMVSMTLNAHEIPLPSEVDEAPLEHLVKSGLQAKSDEGLLHLTELPQCIFPFHKDS